MFSEDETYDRIIRNRPIPIPLDTIKTKTRKITQTPYRLKIDDRISTYTYPGSTIKLITLRFDTLKRYQINKDGLGFFRETEERRTQVSV
jgi:hypothetical protein